MCSDKGDGCDACDGGTYEITECPLDYIGSDIRGIMSMVTLYEKGIAPVAGGSLDQTHCFNEAARFIWGEQNFWQAKMMDRAHR